MVGDSIMYALSKLGLQKLCNKTVTIQSNGGATPLTLTIPPISTTTTDVVVHVGTNSINGDNEQQTTPQNIADNISQRVRNITETNKEAKIYFSSIIQRTDLADENGSITAANEKIQGTNTLMKDYCDANGHRFIDNSNVAPEDLYDGLHLNKSGALKLAKNVSTAIRGLRGDTVTTQPSDTTATHTAFRRIKPQTLGEKADIRHSTSDRNRRTPTFGFDRNRGAAFDRSRRARAPELPARPSRHDNHSNGWPPLPHHDNWANNTPRQLHPRDQQHRNDSRLVHQQQTEFMTSLINNLLNSCTYSAY